MRMPWRRPDDVPPGQVWLRFQGKSKDGRPGQWFQVRDLDEKYKDQCIEFMTNTFLRDEPLCIVLNIPEDSVSVQNIRDNWQDYISQGVSLACFTEEGGAPAQLVGFNIIVVRTRDEEDDGFEKMKGDGVRKLFTTLIAAENLVNIFDYFGVDTFMSSSGLTVDERYRGQNIGARIMEARKPLCKALGIKAVATVFTAKSSQVLAAKCGYELIASLPYEDMKKVGIDLSACTTKTAEVRGIRFDF